MKTKNDVSNVHYDVYWKDKSKRHSKYITIGICSNLEEVVTLVQSKCSHSGKDDFQVFEVRIGEMVKLIVEGNLKNYAS